MDEENKKLDASPEQKGLTRRDFIKIAAATTGAAIVAGSGLPQFTETALAAGGKLDTPTISCVGSTQHTIFLQICAGPSGAQAGFSIQWVKHSDFPSLTCGACNQGTLWPDSSAPSNCNGSFSGVPGCSIYNLGPNACVTVEIGNLNDALCGVSLHNCGANELDCGTEYVFRAFAHNVPGGKNRSDFTCNKCCSTEDCVQGCVLTQGYWKTHPCNWPSPFVPGTNGTALSTQCALTNNPNQQCACDATNTINIGSVAYTQCDLLCALADPGSGNALLILAHQLIAAKLNVFNGATPPSCGDGDALIGSLNILTDTVDPFSALGQQMTAVAACLDLYNNGDGGVPHCP